MGGSASQIGVPNRDDKGGSEGGPKGRRRRSYRRAKKRSPREAPPEWGAAIGDHYPELLHLLVEWQRGSGDYLPMEELSPEAKELWMFGDVDGEQRKRVPPDKRQALGVEMAQEIWDYLCELTDAHGPHINFALIGIGTSKKGEEHELFRIARACNLRSEHGLPFNPDEEGRESDTAGALRWFGSATRDLLSGNTKMLGAVADPMKEVGGMIGDAAATYRTAFNAYEDVIRAQAEFDHKRDRLKMWRDRLQAGERLAKHAMDLFAADLGPHLLHLMYAKYGGEPAPATIQDACKELVVTLPAAVRDWLDDQHEDLGHDFMMALAQCAQAHEEIECAATFRALAPKLSPLAEGIRHRLNLRGRVVWRCVVGRLLIYQVEL